jgi:hypothetical protein
MAEPTAQRLRVRFTVKRTDNDRFMLACDPLASESAPVIPGSDPTESEAAIAAREPTETEAVIRGVCVRTPRRCQRSASETLSSAADGHALAPDIYSALTCPFARRGRRVPFIEGGRVLPNTRPVRLVRMF